MPTKTLDKARLITPQQLTAARNPVPRSWLKVAGILKGKKKINALAYQKQIRKTWETRLAKLERLAK